jgi:predicted phage tail component-like protein
LVNFKHNIYFNGIPLPSFVIIKKIETPLLSEIENTIVDSDIGYKHKKIKFGIKSVKIDFSLERTETLTDFNQQQELLKWLKGDDWKESKLILPDNVDYHYMAICNNAIDIANEDIEGGGRIEFLICNPYRIANKSRIININDLQNYSTLGNVYIKPRIIFSITSECTEIKLSLKNKQYDNFIRFKHNFLTGDKLVIDMKTKKVTVNDELMMSILTLDSKFHEIDNNLRNNKYSLDIGNADVTLEIIPLYQ